ncbi:MAG: O-linked N-acetylglucosamine transferase, SPINDLY family protein [Hassallia sp. WJT32-NPBG1]|jgi:predicted O-linked N-acetylglucosamine transferase (SPINDLY family)|nr:O-linked N-acetylglucosamine transferase, SPINDLY family protein [Hassallia sp. WJT32-NPBG1]
MSSLTAPVEFAQRAKQYFIQGNYTQAASLYEQAIDAEPNVKSHYWYLGLILLLQGQELEAQTTWFMAIVEEESEEIELCNKELVQVLRIEAERREVSKEDLVVEKIRQQIKEIFPQDINNLLHLVNLAIKLETYTGEEITELRLLEILKLSQLEVDFDLLMQVLRSVLDFAPLHPSSLEFAETCLPHVQDNTQTFLNTLLPSAVNIAYSYRQPGIAARLCEIYLRLDAKETELLCQLATFYQNACEYDKGIETARLFYSLVKELPDQVFANRQVLRGLMSAGGYWEEAYTATQKQESLVLSIIDQKPITIEQIQILRLYNSNFFTSYFEDNPRKNRELQNNLCKVSQLNTEIHSQNEIQIYSQGHLKRKQHKSSNKKLKLGYISHCLRSHSVGWLARWIFQHHDRDNFEIHGYFINNKPACDPLHEWYVNQVDKAFYSNKLFEAAEEIYRDEIDILIDLDSITIDTTCHILALKPAPIQVTWLGWDASGIPTIDYYIADPYVLPQSAQEYYTEKIWRLPQTYIAVDGFEVGVPTLRREQLNIENDAVVYLCAQRGFKRHPDTVRLQLKIIKEVPNSYFLIKGAGDEESNRNFFNQIAEEEGVDFSRLRFLPDLPSEAGHRANLGIADIVLDTYPYNGATTTLETLWMGIPLVTRVGEQFAARNSYTMMMNAGITEGIAWTNEEYIEWGIRLGKDEALRQKIAWKLKASRQTAPLWNGKQFTREMEKAYEQMWQSYISS